MAHSIFDIDLPQGLRIRPRRIDLSPFDPNAAGSSQSVSSVYAYLGIPYAKPPVGDLRWRPPQRLPVHQPGEPITLLESQWQPDAHQNIREQLSITVGREGHKTTVGQSEDCLTLNIWVPETVVKARQEDANKLFPVGVWIHGGGFSSGSSSMPLHDGSRLANETGTIIISLQYRLGPLACLAGAALAEEDAGPDPYFPEVFKSPKGKRAQGNYGFWDAAAALRWLQENVASFGGDKSKVTVFGESAGAILIHYLMLSSAVPGDLFSRAILQSGVASNLPARSQTSSQALFDYLVTTLRPELSTASPKEQLAALREFDYEAIIKALVKLGPIRRPRKEYYHGGRHDQPAIRTSDAKLDAVLMWGATWDGVFVGDDYRECLQGGFNPRNGNAKDGVIIGWTADEGSMFNLSIASKPSIHRYFDTFNPVNQEHLRKIYGIDRIQRDEHVPATAAAVTGDALLLAGILRTTKSLVSNPEAPPTRVYTYAIRPSRRHLDASTPCPELIEEAFGCMHTGEIALAFGFDGTEPHTRAVGDSYGVNPDSSPRAPVRTSTSMTPEELELSKTVMSHWGAFIKREDGSLWPIAEPINTKSGAAADGLDAMKVLALGDAAQFGDPRGCVSHAAKVTPLKHMVFWDSKVSPECAPLKERMDFWMDLDNWSQEYYGHKEYIEPL